MGVVDVTKKETGLPVIEAMIQSSVPESVLQADKTYMTGSSFNKSLTFKGKTYNPEPLQLVSIEDNKLKIVPAPANFTFVVGGKTFKVNADRTQIVIVAGSEPIIWRLIKAIQSSNPTNTSSTFLPAEQGIITNGVAESRFSYFYTLNDIYQSEPLQDGVIFRLIEPGSGAIAWRKFAKAGDSGVFEDFATVPSATIASIKNINFADLQNLDAIVDALDTVDGKPFTAAIFGRDGKSRIEMAILVNAQTNQVENGLYYFDCVKGDNAESSASRISPYQKNTIAYIGRARCLVWEGDRWGQDEAWLRSSKPIGSTSSAPRVSMGNGVHDWSKSKTELSIEQQIATLMAEEGIGPETDTIALDALKAAKTEITDAIALKATSADVNAALAALEKDIDALDSAKASGADLKKAQDAIAELTTLLADNTATDAELETAVKAAQDAIAKIKSVSLMTQIESSRAPTIADLDSPWSEWWFYEWDMPSLKALIWVWKRSPVSNDLFPPLNPIGQIDIVLAPVDLPNGNKRLEMPQGATFDYTVTRAAGTINQFSFVAGTFSGAASYYLDASKGVLSTGARAHTFGSTQQAAGLGISVGAPSNAAFVRYEFFYVAGGTLTHDYAI